MVKDGYKQTDIGVFPDDWEIIELRKPLGQLEAGTSVNSSNDIQSTHRILKTSAVHNGKVDIKESKEVIPSDIPRLKCPVRQGSIIISRMNTPQLVGECGYVSISQQDVYLPDRLWQTRNVEGYDYRWLNYLLNLSYFRNAVRASATGTSNSMKNISKDDMYSILIPCPRNEEQKAIAEALSDIDALIDSLEKLIEKKKAIKQGAMQELLTGKRRLEGFTTQWRSASLKEICTRIGVGLATSVTQHYRETGAPIFRNLNIKPNYLDDSDLLFLDEEFAKSNPGKTIHTGDVLTVHTGYVGISCVVPAKYDGSLTFTTLITTTKKETLLPEYLAFHLNSDLGHLEIERLQAGGGRNNLNVGDFVKYTLKYPSDIEEQKRIVEVLSDLESDIRILTQKLEKCKNLKQGMMAELLTGRIRLI